MAGALVEGMPWLGVFAPCAKADIENSENAGAAGMTRWRMLVFMVGCAQRVA